MYMEKKKINNILKVIVLVIILALVMFPIIWMLPAAFKPRTEIFAIPNRFFPQKPTLSNLKKIFNPSSYDNWNFVNSFFATLLVSVVGVILSLFINTLTAYVFARLEFKGKKILWVYFLFSMFVPGITILITSFRVVSELRMLDTLAVLIIPGVANSYNIFFFRQFFLNVPTALEEAAILDGASKFKIYYSIFLPLSISPMIVSGASVFMGYWNSFLWPTLTITENTNIMQISQVLRILSARYTSDYGIVISGTILSLIGPLIMFAIAQRKIISGEFMSGIK